MTRMSLIVLLALCGGAQADDTITKNNSRHLPPAEVTRPEWQDREGPSVDNPACTGLDPLNTSMFEAGSEETAWKGTWLLGEAARNAARADFAPRLKCLGSNTFPRECAAELAALKPGNIGEIRRCPDEEWVAIPFRSWTRP